MQDFDLNEEEEIIDKYDFFKILCKRIISASESKNFHEAFSEWEPIALITNENDFESGILNGDYEDDLFACICTHDIRYRWIMSNKLNGLTVHVGTKCVEKFFPHAKEKMKHFQMCKICKNEKPYKDIEKHNKTKIHLRNLEKINN